MSAEEVGRRGINKLIACEPTRWFFLVCRQNLDFCLKDNPVIVYDYPGDDEGYKGDPSTTDTEGKEGLTPPVSSEQQGDLTPVIKLVRGLTLKVSYTVVSKLKYIYGLKLFFHYHH